MEVSHSWNGLLTMHHRGTACKTLGQQAGKQWECNGSGFPPVSLSEAGRPGEGRQFVGRNYVRMESCHSQQPGPLPGQHHKPEQGLSCDKLTLQRFWEEKVSYLLLLRKPMLTFLKVSLRIFYPVSTKQKKGEVGIIPVLLGTTAYPNRQSYLFL